MCGEIIDWNSVLALANYGPRPKEPRRLLASVIGSTRDLERYHSLEELETRKFLARARPSLMDSQNKSEGELPSPTYIAHRIFPTADSRPCAVYPGP